MRGESTLNRNSDQQPRILSAYIRRVRNEHMLLVGFADARILGLPLSLFPTLADAKAAERNDIELIAKGRGLRWPRLDLDLSADGLLAGRPDFTARAKEIATERRMKGYFKSLASFTSKNLAS